VARTSTAGSRAAPRPNGAPSRVAGLPAADARSVAAGRLPHFTQSMQGFRLDHAPFGAPAAAEARIAPQAERGEPRNLSWTRTGSPRGTGGRAPGRPAPTGRIHSPVPRPRSLRENSMPQRHQDGGRAGRGPRFPRQCVAVYQRVRSVGGVLRRGGPGGRQRSGPEARAGGAGRSHARTPIASPAPAAFAPATRRPPLPRRCCRDRIVRRRRSAQFAPLRRIRREDR
jgi:hypothetical protein